MLDDAHHNGDATGGAVLNGTELNWSGPLAVGAQVTITYSVTVDQPDTGNQVLRNAVTPGTGGTCASDDACSTVVPVTSPPPPPPAQSSLALSKWVDSMGPFAVGDRVASSSTVTNTGDTVLNDITVTDDHVSQVTCDATTLAPGASTVCHGVCTITSSALEDCRQDTKAGTRNGTGTDGACTCTVTNTAYATASDPDGEKITSAPARATITVAKESGHKPPHKGPKKNHDGAHGSGYGKEKTSAQHI